MVHTVFCWKKQLQLMVCLCMGLGAVVCFCRVCLGASATAIKENIARETTRASEKKEALTRLSAKERKLFKNLARVEDQIRTLETQLEANRRELKDLEDRKAVMQKRYEASRATRERLHEEAASLLRTLWPVFLTGQASKRFDQGDSWARAQRESTWLSALYGQTGTKLFALQKAETQALEDLKHFEEASRAAQAKDEELRAVQEDLLAKRLGFLSQVKKIRSQELDLKEELASIAQTIKDLHYKLQILDTRSFPKLKGHLPWPAKGRLVKGFHPKAQPPHRGLSLAVNKDDSVRAVSWGKVVYDDQLRGFGRVIIVFHGKDYYSLYAFLSQSRVRVGQKIEKGEIIGQCGYYPRIKGTGLYFELRFGQKAINPLHWLEPA
ncbi:murein hydrolase activator EnvC family protein [Desulfoplanes formicivorans]|uniref:Peptidase M23 n=1 Tax=Desulfoplanes formicivorans TaxID=1592317 RepID=A0A194AIL9_9BACT|nr:peptidoglycan DD-metalloendopeptidase family protein [Desulfoplanes formicivorans]GAU09932.1 peptidase M23 [Desulfoplanes formicivorans]